MFRFANQYWLYALALAPVLAGFFVFTFRLRRKALARFGNLVLIERLSRSTSRRRQAAKAAMLVAAVCCLLLALARPQLGAKLGTVTREGVDVVIALDVSRSMLAEDIQPNRLEKAKHEIASLIDRLQGDRVGLVAFAGRGFVQCPLTLDYGAARMFLDFVGPDLVPVPGTAVAEAVTKATAAFVEKERKHKVLILITDGEDHEGRPVEAAKEAAKEGVVIYTVGIGSPQGVPIPESDAAGNRIGFKKDRQGQVVMTRLDDVTLEKIALETGGKYYRASTGEAELTQISDAISKMEKKGLASQQFVQFEDRFQFLIGLAIALLVAEAAFSDRRRLKKEWKGRFE
jgi:Ca-activated chloride channel family protein